MKADKIYNIPFVGLKIGSHLFEYAVNDSFFDDFEYSLVKKGDLKVVLKLEKKETMILAFFKVEGSVFADCDRCTAPVKLEIKGSYDLVYKFGTDDSDDESLIVLHPDEYQINVEEPIYELITISLPTRKIHNDGECDEEMMSLVKEYTINSDDDEENFDDDEDWDEEEDDDDSDDISPWDILKNLN